MSALDHVTVFEEHRGFLFGLAYRMLGSAMDAEDLVQESFLNFQKSDPATLREPRAFLSTILTRRVLDHLKSARVRREEYVGHWLPEPLLTEDDPQAPAGALEQTESVSTAFLLMLETLSPVERAVYLLRDVFDFDYGEIAPIVERSAETVRRIASRARERLQASQRAPRFQVSRDNQERLLDRFLRACRGGDLEELVGVLAADARIYSDGGGKVTAAMNPIFGSVNSARFLLGVLRKDPPRFPRKVTVNGQPALAMFYLDGKLDSISTFDYSADRLENLYIVRNPDKLERIAAEIRPGRLRTWWYRLLFWWLEKTRA